jgi:hypothetical protein
MTMKSKEVCREHNHDHIDKKNHVCKNKDDIKQSGRRTLPTV